MTRRRASNGTLQPAKRTKVDGPSIECLNGSAGSRASNDDTQKDAPDDTPDDTPVDAPPSPVSPSPAPRSSRPRRAAATKSAAATNAIVVEDGAAASVPSRDAIHERLFAPITETELKAWKGWSDIESEPAFFNFILKELGVQDATIFELFGVDESSISYLPDPLGLIFLYKFVEEGDEEAYEDCPENLWFANQTTANACGTIAMLNIAMNCDRLGLGDHLTRFKTATQPLHPALRGHLLSTDETIRSKHNSFARRIDMLVSDLSLKLEWAEAGAKTAKAASSRKSTKKKKKKADEDEAAFHFIAYVPMGNDVWELNGMQEKPLKLGSFDGDWTAMARERIATRMRNYAAFDDTAIFNLLALCHTPKILKAGETNGANGTNETNGTTNSEPMPTDDDDEGGVRRAAARKGDYTPAVHSWLKKLADKGVLQRLATGEPDEPLGEGDEM
ncbi:hypothetical protein SEUCBS139899_008385 [Sporothrix eucalyptigena]|uniref:ubiquitinyl hydrolase 1 n=1 Tax=Sporothrix eucalyptigena TaxID=1812306 RepID=A0ABP0CJW4_9PEZI